MKQIILYYTFGGSTMKEAERLAKQLDIPAYRVRECRERSLLNSFYSGGFQAMTRKTVPIRPIDVDLGQFERIIIGCPVWAGFPAPAFNSILDILPSGMEIEVFFCAGGGDRIKANREL